MTEHAENGKVEAVERITIPTDLMQAILDYLSTCPAGHVYALLQRLDQELAAPAVEEPVE